MTTFTENTVEPSEVARAFWRYRGRIVLFVAFVSAVTLIAVVFVPRKYASESKLFVRVGRESVGLDPTATTGKTMTIQTTREVELQSVHELLKSRGMLEQVVELIGAERLLEDPDPNVATRMWSQVSGIKGQLIASLVGESGLSLEERQRESARELLEDSVGVSVAKNTTVITIKARARSPELAQEIASTLVDSYLLEHARIHRTAGSEAFFADQTQRIGAELQRTEKQLHDTKNEYGLVTIEGQLALVESQKADVEREQLRTARLLAESESTYHSLRIALNEVDEMVLLEREERPNSAADAMRHQLYELEVQEQEYLAKYTPEHPLLQAVSTQLAESRKIHDGMDEFRDEPTYAINPVRQKLEAELLDETSRLASLKALDASLNAQATALAERLRVVNTQALQIEALKQEAKLLNKSYEAYSTNLEQARIDGALQQQQITNINIAQAATISHRPTSPRIAILFLMGLVTAVGGSVALAFGSERLNRRLRSAEEIEADLSIPVIMTLPRFSNSDSLTSRLSV